MVEWIEKNMKKIAGWLDGWTGKIDEWLNGQKKIDG